MVWWLQLLGCTGTVTYPGSPTRDLFPFDCERHWEFISTDTSLPYKLIAESNLEPEKDSEGDNVYTVVYTKQCQSAGAECVPGDVVRKVQFSSPDGDGVSIHGYAEGGGPIVPLEPPVELTLKEQKKGEVVETESGGLAWEATLVAIEACPVKLTVDWTDCYRFDLVVPADETLGEPIAGSYWAIGGQGIVALELVGETGRWELSSEDHQGDCNGQW
jgi:hypothetical protein